MPRSSRPAHNHRAPFCRSGRGTGGGSGRSTVRWLLVAVQVTLAIEGKMAVKGASGDWRDGEGIIVRQDADGFVWFVRRADAVIVGDYGKGVVTQPMLDRLKTVCRERGVLLAVDNCFTTPYLQQPVRFGADLVEGPYSFTNLALAFQQAMSGNRLDSVTFADFAPYAPALDAPTGWAVAPLARMAP